MKGFTWSQTTLGPRVQFGLAHLSMEHINLVQSVYTCLGQNEGLVREATFPNHKKKVCQDGSHLGSHCLLQECLGITCESLFAVILIILVRQWLQGSVKCMGSLCFALLLNNMECLVKL